MRPSLHRAAAAAVALLLTPAPALAADMALLLSNTEYPDRSDRGAAAAAEALARQLRARGFEVSLTRNAAATEAWDDLRRFEQRIEAADRVLVLVQGDIVSAGGEAWLLARDARRPDVLAVGGQGVALSAVLRMMEDKQGQAVVLAAMLTGGPAPGEGLRAGLGELAPPQGISLLSGPSEDLLPYVEDYLLKPGRSIGTFLSAAPDTVEGRGFLPRAVPFLPPPQGVEGLTERDFWETVDILGTADAYQGYLERYPRGQFAGVARQRLAELETTRSDAARSQEEALGLTREQRRAIQRDLSILGYDTGGIDGIFGPSTRASIAAWQRENTLEGNSFLTANQISRLREQAAERNRILQEEARARREELERRDRAYWAQTGEGGTEEGLLDYLERYPDGLFAEEARQRLDEIDRRKRREAASADRAAWERAAAADTRAAYRRYLEDYPEGAFARQARTRIAELEEEEANREDIEAAKAEEAQLMTSPIVRLLVKQGLRNQGFDPGVAGDRFDAQTRRAIRQFQRAYGLRVTGYVDRPTMVRLLAAQAQP